MTYLVFLLSILSLLAKESLATKKCVNPGLQLDITTIVDNYARGASYVPVPIIESGDDSGAAFRDLITNAVKTYGTTLLNGVLCQALETGERLVNCIQKTSYELHKSIKFITSHKSKPNSLNDELEQVTIQLNKVLDLKPGNVEIIPPPLPPLPQQQVEVESRTTRRTPTELFLQFDTVLYNLAVNVFGFINVQFLGGWRDAKSVYQNVSSQIRNQILNDQVLAAGRIAVDKIRKHKDLVREHVLQETWKRFKKAGDHIIAISNDYNATKNGEDSCSSCNTPYN